MLTPQALKTLTQTLKYVGLLLTSVISLHGLTRETYDKAAKRLTPAGRRHAALLTLSALLAFTSAYFENRADVTLKQIAADEGDRRFQEKLGAANQLLVDRLHPEFQDLVDSQGRETKKSIKEIRAADADLNRIIGSTIPIKTVNFTVRLSDWSKMTIADRVVKRNEPGRVSQSDWDTTMCMGRRPWSMEMYITSTLKLTIGTAHSGEQINRDHELRGACGLPAFVEVESSPYLKEIDDLTSRPLYDDVVELKGNINRDDVPEDFRWRLHQQSLEVHEDISVIWNDDHAPEHELTIIVPRNVAVTVNAEFAAQPDWDDTRTYRFSKAITFTGNLETRGFELDYTRKQ